MKVTSEVYYYPGRLFDSNIFIITDQNGLLMVDTGTGMFHEDLKKQLKSDGLNIKEVSRVILTHVHIDHSGGLAKIVEESSPEVMVFYKEADSVEKGNGIVLADFFGIPFTPMRVHVRLKESDIIKVGDLTLKVLNTPGHTAGSICLYEPEKEMLFSGDTVFTDGGFGRVDFPTGDPRQLVSSLKRLSELNVKYLFPGHLGIATDKGQEHIKLSLRYAELVLNS